MALAIRGMRVTKYEVGVGVSPKKESVGVWLAEHISRGCVAYHCQDYPSISKLYLINFGKGTSCFCKIKGSQLNSGASQPCHEVCYEVGHSSQGLAGGGMRSYLR